jgi:drug/metabolite transporter (DMT)-like permease
LHLGVIYVVWGSTYLAIRVAVGGQGGFGPFWLGASRVLLAGAVLLILARLRGRRVLPTRSEVVVLAVSGVALWVGGNGLVNWAETRVDSGLAALIVGTMPMWVAAMEAVVDRRAPSVRLVTALVVGFAGLTVLTVPVLREGARGDLPGVLAVIGAAVAWGGGSLYQRRRGVGLGPLASSGWQQMFGGVGFVLVAALLAEPLPSPTAAGWAAWVYLVVFGSILAFTSYVTALAALPTSLVMTYTYVNPVIAVGLGWLLLSESVTWWTLAGTALILAGVAGVFRDRSAPSG